MQLRLNRLRPSERRGNSHESKQNRPTPTSEGTRTRGAAGLGRRCAHITQPPSPWTALHSSASIQPVAARASTRAMTSDHADTRRQKVTLSWPRKDDRRRGSHRTSHPRRATTRVSHGAAHFLFRDLLPIPSNKPFTRSIGGRKSDDGGDVTPGAARYRCKQERTHRVNESEPRAETSMGRGRGRGWEKAREYGAASPGRWGKACGAKGRVVDVENAPYNSLLAYCGRCSFIWTKP